MANNIWPLSLQWLIFQHQMARQCLESHHDWLEMKETLEQGHRIGDIEKIPDRMKWMQNQVMQRASVVIEGL